MLPKLLKLLIQLVRVYIRQSYANSNLHVSTL